MPGAITLLLMAQLAIAVTAALAILTGIVGAVGARHVYAAPRIENDAVRGFAPRLASHRIGTARAFQIGEQTGAFAAMVMGLNGLLTALLLPWLIPPLMRWLAGFT